MNDWKTSTKDARAIAGRVIAWPLAGLLLLALIGDELRQALRGRS